MPTEQPISESPVLTRQHKSQAALHKLIQPLCRAADDRRTRGYYAEAEPLYLLALVIFEREYGPEHDEIAVNLNHLAALKQAQGNGNEAERLYRRALAIKEKLLGPEHPDVAVALNDLAVFYKVRGRYPEAATLYRRALAILEQSFGPQHPKAVICR